MESSTRRSKHETPTLPMASHSFSALDLYEWLKEEVENIGYGKVGLELTVYRGAVTRVEKKLVLSEKNNA